MVEIARIFTFGTSNRRDVIKRLMACCKSFKNMSFPDAVAQYRYYEKSGLIHFGDGYLAIYHNCN